MSGVRQQMLAAVEKYSEVPTIMWHVAPTTARQSIQQHGLDWTKGQSGTDYRTIGSEPANYLWPLEQQALESQQRHWDGGQDFDVWQVDVTGLQMDDDPVWTEASRVFEPVGPERMQLVAPGDAEKI